MVSHKPPAVVNFFNLLLSPFSRCVLVHLTICYVCSFDTIYHPTDFTVMNETQKLWCIMIDFMLYLLYGQQNRQKKKNPEKTKQKHYRCKAEVFFPSCIFLRCCKKKKKRLYFSTLLSISRTLTVMQNPGPRLSALFSEHEANSGYSFYVFIKGFQRWNYIFLFSVWIVLLFLSILHFTNKTLILL